MKFLIKILFLFALIALISGKRRVRQGRRGRGKSWIFWNFQVWNHVWLGLDRCKPFVQGCSFRRRGNSARAFFVVDNFVEGDLDCRNYLPTNPDEDMEVDDPHDAIESLCAVSSKIASFLGSIFKTGDFYRTLLPEQRSESACWRRDMPKSCWKNKIWRKKTWRIWTLPTRLWPIWSLEESACSVPKPSMPLSLINYLIALFI